MKEINVNLKMVCFDMDGTIADLYGVNDWLSMLRNENPLPYQVAKPMWDMTALAEILMALKLAEVEIRVISWLSKDSTEEYKSEVRKAKKEWLDEVGFPYDKLHFVQYGATKADSIRKYLAENETAMLIDDSKAVRKGWHLGETVDPTECDILEVLKNLLG